ncbi:hypothetical protein BGZ58_001574 [Dissophora ornata]|nr:hypothetical protein BGZ58_001574 [Dissophora ornata]
MAKTLTLLCLINGEPLSNTLKVKADEASDVGDLKDLIKAKMTVAFSDVDTSQLTLWRVSIPDCSATTVGALVDKTELNKPRTLLSNLFPKSSDDNTYIIVQRPPQDEKWQELVSKIEDGFFAPASANYTRLVRFLTADQLIPTTGGPLGGLPFVAARALSTEQSDRLTLLFLDLPESTERQDPPSTADKALGKIRGRAVPLLQLFGVSGCGKTRTAIEMLSKNWGFYFNGSTTDRGSQDLARFLELVHRTKRYGNRDFESNIHILALGLVLSRVIILEQCLNIAEHLFALLFMSIADVIHRHSIDISLMGSFVRTRFSEFRQRLLKLTLSTPSQHVGYKILLVVDEAQNFGKMDFGAFPSEGQVAASSFDDYQRPVLSPLVHGFYQISGDHSHFCVVTCGTGLCILDMNWLEDSAPVTKGYTENLGPFTDFQGWESLEQVQIYRDLVRRSLPDEQARRIFDTRVPGEAVSELFARLRGRFRPIVSAIERMICARNGQSDWKKAIQDTEETLISIDRQFQGKGNIPYDIDRMLHHVATHPSQYAKYQRIQTVLELFVLEHYLHGNPVILNAQEAPLVEASVGTVLDEPFALRATVNYFRKGDPDFHGAICNLFSLESRNDSALGSTWEMAVLPSLVHVFHNKILSETSPVPLDAVRCDSLLNSRATIVGLGEHMLGIDHSGMLLSEFLEAHVENGSRSRNDDSQVPAFYYPTETPSGPDVVFVLRFDKRGLCPVFIKLKLPVFMDSGEVLKAFATVKADAVQHHLGDSKLETFCTVSPKKYLGVVIAYPTELPSLEGSFADTSPQCISLKIDENNIHDLFPEAHVNVLDRLKRVERKLEQAAMTW